MAPPLRDITGLKHHRLTALSFVGYRPKRGAVWLFQCDCGTQIKYPSRDLLFGTTKSCGCLMIERAIENCKNRATHGQARRSGRSKTYHAWANMLRRCKPDSDDARFYHDRGISVCDEWHNYANFLRDMGEAPRGLTLDRVDPCKNYEVGNCRWATWSVQHNNTRANRFITVAGESLTIADAARKYGISRSAVYQRLRRLGYNPEQAVGLQPAPVTRERGRDDNGQYLPGKRKTAMALFAGIPNHDDVKSPDPSDRGEGGWGSSGA